LKVAGDGCEQRAEIGAEIAEGAISLMLTPPQLLKLTPQPCVLIREVVIVACLAGYDEQHGSFLV
jgi:hypothetical protein